MVIERGRGRVRAYPPADALPCPHAVWEGSPSRPVTARWVHASLRETSRDPGYTS